MSATATAPAGLLASPPQPLPFAPSLEIRAFVLPRATGDLLVYSTTAPVEHAGIARQYLNHWHEAMFVSPEMDAPVFVHEADGARTRRRIRVRATFGRRHLLDGDFEAIPIPGHTPGATAYLWDGGEQRVLFTGDSLYLRDGEWIAAVLDSSDRDAYLASLQLIRELDFDVLVPWAASAGGPWFAHTDPADRRRRIDAVLDRIRGGADH